jgi:hypothetical protein
MLSNFTFFTVVDIPERIEHYRLLFGSYDLRNLLHLMIRQALTGENCVR